MNLVAEQPRILIVDDNLAYANLLQLALEHAEFGEEIQTVQGGKEAIDYLSRTQNSQGDRTSSFAGPHLIFTDLNMPCLSGLELLAWIRNSPYFKHLPVIVMSSYVEPLQLEMLNNLGASYYFDKPLTLKELLEHLNQIREQIQTDEAAVA